MIYHRTHHRVVNKSLLPWKGLTADLCEFSSITRQPRAIKSDMFDNISTDEVSTVITVQLKVELPARCLADNIQANCKTSRIITQW